MPPLSVLHLVGSAVDEFHADLSRLYAGACLEALVDPDGYDVHLAYVSPDGSWRFPSDLSAGSLATALPMSIADAIAHLTLLEVDVAVPQMFCLVFGKDQGIIKVHQGERKMSKNAIHHGLECGRSVGLSEG